MSHQGPPETAVKKLPVMDTVQQAYVLVFGNLGPLARAAALPFALSLALSFMVTSSQFIIEWGSLLRLLSLVPLTLFAVAWYRFVLLGPAQAMPSITPKIEARHIRFFFFAAILWLIEELPWQSIVQGYDLLLAHGENPPPEAIQEAQQKLLPGFFLLLFAFFLILRFAFVLPAVAVDETYGFRASWNHTRGQVLRLVLGMVMLAVPMIFLLLMVMSIGASASGGTGQGFGLFTTLMVQGLQYVIQGLLFTFIAISFRECTGWVPAAAPTVMPSAEPDPED